jgi:hypothetical protein
MKILTVEIESKQKTHSDAVFLLLPHHRSFSTLSPSHLSTSSLAKPPFSTDLDNNSDN